MSTSPAFVCEQCGRGGDAAPGRSLPANWERRRPDDYSSPVWCGRCILDLLDALLAEMRKAAAAGLW